MRIVWAKSPVTAHVIIGELRATKNWSVSTVKTLLNRLVKKRVRDFEKTGPQYLYRAAISQQECRTSEMKSFLARVFDGALPPMLAHYVQNQPLSEREIGELEQILKQRAQ